MTRAVFASVAVVLAGCHAQVAPATAAASVATPATDPFVATVRRIEPTVVLLTMRLPSDDAKRKGKFDEAYGTGFVVASGPWGSQILTVEHVIHDARNLRATLGDARAVPARVTAADEQDDLALVRIASRNRPVAVLGASRSLEPGTQIGVAGYPIPDAFQDERLGVKTSVFAGRVSSLRRDSVELDVPIIPGESGGPVFDARTGVVVALAESRFDEEKAIGFGVPIEDANRFLHGKLHP